jgi:hypothetical protein
MASQRSIAINWEEARLLLGVCEEAGEEQIRSAYLAKVREFPPDKDPDAFERIRDAYDQLKDPRARARQVLHCADPSAPLADLLSGLAPVRRFAGPKMWMDALREKMKEPRS